jgi:predicted O-linked N-acetylglucosamine transferase (SPINDLY family)
LNRQQRRAAAKRGASLAGFAAAGATTGQRRADLDAQLAAAAQHYQRGQFREAARLAERVLAAEPNNIAALQLGGLLALVTGRYDAAIDILGSAIRLNDKAAELHATLAEALQRAGRSEEAIAEYQRALALEPDNAETIYNCANVLLRLGNHAEALSGYDRALAIQPGFVRAVHNRGNALFELQRFDEALADYDCTLEIDPRFVMAWSNRANALLQLRRYEEALAACDRGLEIDARHVASLSVRANALFELRRFAEAAEAYDRLLVVDPAYPYALGRAFYCRLLCCDWTDYDRTMALVASKVAAGERAVPPFMFLNMADSPEQRMHCARTFSRDRHPAAADPLWRGERYRHTKIRLGYLSADFRHHPMAYLMAGLFERHDRSCFETTAFSFGPDPRDEFRRRLEGSFDRFIDVRTKRDRELAQLVREREIDIAVDLMGYTNNGRPGILAYRPAPIQVNYIGFAGTLGADYIDYIIADRFIIPEHSRRFYTEHVAHLPDTYWPTDSTRAVGRTMPTRFEVGLLEPGFVFCCFNQSHKIAPGIFDIWMRLLRQVEGSVLWLVEDNADAAGNLRREAERRGVAAARLVFASRVGLDEYLARLPLADLLLDTLPFNAHTTASDALWAGVPVVTCAGSSFAARVAGSLLGAVGLPELITDNLADYEALALKLARDPSMLARIRAKLDRNRQSYPLFDTDRFRRHIESAYQTMWERQQRGEPPSDLAVAPIDA